MPDHEKPPEPIDKAELARKMLRESNSISDAEIALSQKDLEKDNHLFKPEKAAEFLIVHIENPLGGNESEEKKTQKRAGYLADARKLLPHIQDSLVRQRLEAVMSKYTENSK